MILISVKSNVVEDKRQFETHEKAMKFLLQIDKLHHAHRKKIAGKKPKKLRGKGVSAINRKNLKEWENILKTCIWLKIEIINTNTNQLNLFI